MDGDLSSRIDLRKTDQLKKLQGTFNAALNKLDGQIKDIKGDIEEAHKLALQAGGEKDMRTLEKYIFRIKEKISFFRTSR